MEILRIIKIAIDQGLPIGKTYDTRCFSTRMVLTITKGFVLPGQADYFTIQKSDRSYDYFVQLLGHITLSFSSSMETLMIVCYTIISLLSLYMDTSLISWMIIGPIGNWGLRRMHRQFDVRGVKSRGWRHDTHTGSDKRRRSQGSKMVAHY